MAVIKGRSSWREFSCFDKSVKCMSNPRSEKKRRKFNKYKFDYWNNKILLTQQIIISSIFKQVVACELYEIFRIIIPSLNKFTKTIGRLKTGIDDRWKFFSRFEGKYVLLRVELQDTIFEGLFNRIDQTTRTSTSSRILSTSSRGCLRSTRTIGISFMKTCLPCNKK